MINPSLTFRLATIDDAPLIQNLAEKIWRVHYPDIISHEQIDYMLELMYSKNSIELQLASIQQYTLIFCGDELVGYYSISELEAGEFYLHKFYLQVAQHRKGIGSRSFQQLLSTIGSNYGSIRLQVNRRNYKAVNFYFKLGFQIEKTAEFDIGQGYTMDDFVMVKRS